MIGDADELCGTTTGCAGAKAAIWWPTGARAGGWATAHRGQTSAVTRQRPPDPVTRLAHHIHRPDPANRTAPPRPAGAPPVCPPTRRRRRRPQPASRSRLPRRVGPTAADQEEAVADIVRNSHGVQERAICLRLAVQTCTAAPARATWSVVVVRTAFDPAASGDCWGTHAAYTPGGLALARYRTGETCGPVVARNGGPAYETSGVASPCPGNEAPRQHVHHDVLAQPCSHPARRHETSRADRPLSAGQAARVGEQEVTPARVPLRPCARTQRRCESARDRPDRERAPTRPPKKKPSAGSGIETLSLFVTDRPRPTSWTGRGRPSSRADAAKVRLGVCAPARRPGSPHPPCGVCPTQSAPRPWPQNPLLLLECLEAIVTTPPPTPARTPRMAVQPRALHGRRNGGATIG